MLFTVRAKNPDGTDFEVIREAADRYEAARGVRKEGGTVVSVNLFAETTGGKLFSLPRFFKRVTLHERIVFANNLSAMMSAGRPLSRALSIFERQTRNDYFRTVVEDVRRTIDKGGSLHDGLATHPEIFSRVFVSMVAAGEESGTLPESLKVVG
ncbi:MAG: type II secretion system F family protein, partial [Patescibacteria group bacterium]